MCSSLSGMLRRTVAHWIALTIVLSQCAGELITAPQSIESKVGDTTYFNCSTNLTSEEIFWYHGDKYVYTEEGILRPYLGRFEIDRNASDGSHNLVIHSVELSDAGKYICIDDDGHGTRRSAELVVLDNDPDCQSNIQPDGVIGQNIFNIPPDEVQLTCTVTYHGNIPPRMEWKRVGDKSSIKDNATSIVTSNNRLMFTMKFTGDIAVDYSSYICQTTRATQNQYKCASKTIKVMYFIGANMTQQNVIRGDEITCTASNNTFPCISQWYHDNYTCPLSCDDTLTTHLLGEYLCTLKCHVRGTDYFFTALKVVVVEAPATLGTIAASVVIPIAIILLVVLIAVYIVRRNKRKVIKDEQKVQEVIGVVDMDEVKMAGLYYADRAQNLVKRERPRDKVAEQQIELLYKIKKEAKEICGVAILSRKMFIVRQKKSQLEVYDCGNFNHGCKLLNVPQLVDAVDICSCKINNYLYIMDKKEGLEPKEVITINTKEESISNWLTKENAGGYLSATAEGNVIITVQYKHVLLEYSHDGNFKHEIKLPGHINPWHAIKVDNDRYIVSYGTVFDSVHKVCQVDKEGKVGKSFGRERGSANNQLNAPYYLAAASGGCVMVADLGNNRVLLLDSNLKFKVNMVPTYKQEFRCPRRVCLDETLLVVVITEGNSEEGTAVEAGTSGEERDEAIDSSTENDELLRMTEREKIEKDCRLLVFDVQPLLQKV